MSESKQTIPVNGKADAARSSPPRPMPPVRAALPASAASAGSHTLCPVPTPPGRATTPRPRPSQGDLDELGKLAAKRDEYLALAQRTQADFENYRKRVARESALAQERGVGQARQGAAAGDRQPRPRARESPSPPARPTGSAARRRAPRARRAARRARARRHRVLLARRRGVRPARARGDGHRAAAAEGGARSGVVVEVYQPGYRLGESIIRARARGRGRLGEGPDGDTPDYYKMLGVDKKATPRGDQEGLPQARAPVPPGPQPRRQGRRGALQGDLRRPTTCSATPRSASSTTAAPARSRRRGPGGGFGGFGNFDFDASSMGDILSNLFGGAGGPGGAGARSGRQRARPERGADLEAEVSISFDQAVARRAGAAAVPMQARCDTCHGTGAKPGTTPSVCPRCEGRGDRVPGPGHVLDLPALLALRRLRHDHRGPLPDLPRLRRRAHRQAPAREHPRRRTRRQPHPPRRQGRAGSPRRAARRPVPDHARRRPRPSSSARASNFEVEVPLTDARGARAAPTSRCRRSTAPRRCASRQAPRTAPSSACAARDRPSWVAARRPQATSTTAS